MISRMFGGTLIIVRGGKKFMLDESKQKLYQVMQVGRNEDQFRVEQMEADAINLNSDYVFILVSITVELTWVWRGRGARQVEISEAERMAKLMYPYSITSIEEGREPIAFWTVLGGQDPYARNHGKPRLFIVTTSSDGSIEATEVFDYSQTDLSDGGWRCWTVTDPSSSGLARDPSRMTNSRPRPWQKYIWRSPLISDPFFFIDPFYIKKKL